MSLKDSLRQGLEKLEKEKQQRATHLGRREGNFCLKDAYNKKILPTEFFQRPLNYYYTQSKIDEKSYRCLRKRFQAHKAFDFKNT